MPHIAPLMLHHKQQGVTLIELMLGILIGLLTVAVAMAALMVSRSVSGSVSDSSQLQQQAAYAFRVIGQQLRQAGSLRLNLAIQKSDADPIDVADPVAFETKSPNFDPVTQTITGKDNPANTEYKFSVGYANYKEPVYTSSNNTSMLRDCLGQNPNNNIVLSQFKLHINNNTTPPTHELHCASATGSAQAIIQNVANFEVRYLLQSNALFGKPEISYVNAASVGNNWSEVVGVEVCLVLYGNETLDIPPGTSYTDCDGSTPVDLTNLAAPRKRRMHLVFKNIYQLRSQGINSLS